MSTSNDGPELTTEEAAEHLRRLRDTLGPDQLREAFETGGGLMEHEENRLREALDVLGTQRSAEILDVEVPDSGLAGEQVTIGGEPVSGRVPEERAEPVPDETASLSEFERGAVDENQRPEVDEDDIRTVVDRAQELERATDPFPEPGDIVRTEPKGCDQLLDWYAELASITRSTAVILDVVEAIGVDNPEVAKVTMELKTAINHLTTHWNFSNCEGDGDLLERRAFAAVRALEQPDREAGRFVDDFEDAIESVQEERDGTDEGDGNDIEPDCEAHQAVIERLLNSARRQGFLDFNEFDQAVSAAERDGCVSIADATRLRDTAQSAAPEPSRDEFDQLLEGIQRAFDVEERADESKDSGGGTTQAAALTEEEAVDVVQRALNIEGPDAIAAFLNPDEIAPLGQATSFQLSGAAETLGKERIREVAGLGEEDTRNG